MTKVVNLNEHRRIQEADNGDIVAFFEMLLEEAKEGRVTGFAGCAYYEDYGGEPAIGTMYSSIMQDNFYHVIGALRQVEFYMLTENYEDGL